ncbi:hypothetical protein CEP52_015466 [Fusarium oligoseptatum]|uniref:Methyltransferase n=1 Tax=Fusarium oligoseptatum TaxID=2604345 RepID=A0A428SCW3_9HYPO|nr:hypothetical protein CEP52_015466 [Fusarium oligoseptatum]
MSEQATNTSAPPDGDILPPEHWAEIAQKEPGNTDGDSILDADNNSSTASVTSSILEYRTIHGRTYNSEQGNAQYWGSNDAPQRELMDVTHHILTLGLGNKLHLAPLEKGKVQRAIDIGCGTGIWAIDFADDYPDAEITGTDISPIQPSWVPPNLRFEIEDCTREWTFKSNSTDYIHMRWLMGSIRDWDFLSSEAFRVCKPGAWVESHEASSNVDSDDNTKIGTSFTVVEDGTQRKALEKVGFINIQEFDFKNPIGGWSSDPIEKEMGPYTKYGLETDTEGFVLFMAHTLGWSRDEIQLYIDQFRRELRSEKHHGYFKQKVVWGQKPEVIAS